MAREAGAIHIHGKPNEFAIVGNDSIKAFAALVIEAERKRLATECAMLPFGDTAASFAVWIKNGGKA
jgi:hypothetical protein